jgi:predicted nucleic acid-binding Zn ribbon protein
MRRYVSRLATPERVRNTPAVKTDAVLNGRHVHIAFPGAQCDACGKPIELKSVKHRFCSDTCRFKYHDDRRDRRFLSRKEYRAPMAAQNGRKAKFDLFAD